MADYKSMYLALFNSVTDAIQLLMAAQERGEQQYIDSEDTPIMELTRSDTNLNLDSR